jgi:hypothetical protein
MENLKEMVSKMEKIWVVFGIALCLVLIPSFAGMGVSPPSGTYTLSKQGGSIQVVVSNLNTYDRYFAIGPSGTHEGNKYVSNIFPSNKILVKANDFKTFSIQITPDDTVEYGKKYPVALSVADTGETSPNAATGGVGATGTEGADIGYWVIFENKGTVTNYGGVDEGATRARQAQLSKKPNYIPLVLAILLIVLLLAGLIFFISKRKKEEESDEVVVSPTKPK